MVAEIGFAEGVCPACGRVLRARRSSSVVTREKRIIDKEAKRKIHVVEVKNEEGEWVIVHKEDVPL